MTTRRFPYAITPSILSSQSALFGLLCVWCSLSVVSVAGTLTSLPAPFAARYQEGWEAFPLEQMRMTSPQSIMGGAAQVEAEDQTMLAFTRAPSAYTMGFMNPPEGDKALGLDTTADLAIRFTHEVYVFGARFAWDMQYPDYGGCTDPLGAPIRISFFDAGGQEIAQDSFEYTRTDGGFDWHGWRSSVGFTTVKIHHCRIAIDDIRADGAATLTSVGPFVARYQEGWEGFPLEQMRMTSPQSIMGGAAQVEAEDQTMLAFTRAPSAYTMGFMNPPEGDKALGLDTTADLTIRFTHEVYVFGARFAWDMQYPDYGGCTDPLGAPIRISFFDAGGQEIAQDSLAYTRTDGGFDWHGWRSSVGFTTVKIHHCRIAIDDIRAEEGVVLTKVDPFAAHYQEGWEAFSLEQMRMTSPQPIMGGAAQVEAEDQTMLAFTRAPSAYTMGFMNPPEGDKALGLDTTADLTIRFTHEVYVFGARFAWDMQYPDYGGCTDPLGAPIRISFFDAGGQEIAQDSFEYTRTDGGFDWHGWRSTVGFTTVKIHHCRIAIDDIRADGAATLTSVGPFAARYQEGWEAFPLEQMRMTSPQSIMGGAAQVEAEDQTMLAFTRAPSAYTMGFMNPPEGDKALGLDTTADLTIRFTHEVYVFGARFAWDMQYPDYGGCTDPLGAPIRISFFDAGGQEIAQDSFEYTRTDGGFDWHGWRSSVGFTTVKIHHCRIAIDDIRADGAATLTSVGPFVARYQEGWEAFPLEQMRMTSPQSIMGGAAQVEAEDQTMLAFTRAPSAYTMGFMNPPEGDKALGLDTTADLTIRFTHEVYVFGARFAWDMQYPDYGGCTDPLGAPIRISFYDAAGREVARDSFDYTRTDGGFDWHGWRSSVGFTTVKLHHCRIAIDDIRASDTLMQVGSVSCNQLYVLSGTTKRGSYCRIEASSDLVHWDYVAGLYSENGKVEWVETIPKMKNGRFYRVISE